MNISSSEKGPSSSTSLKSTQMVPAASSGSPKNQFDAYQSFIEIYRTSFHIYQQRLSINERRSSLIDKLHSIEVPIL